jgi:DNA-directed RNA polymerase specialized sigma24 family protein
LATTQESFEALLSWLDPTGRDAAGRAYETIRAGLISTLISRGFSNAEDLADETINRVTNRLSDIQDAYEGAPAKYFYGVLRNLIKEQRSVKEVVVDELPILPIKEEKTSQAYDCLVRCLELMPSEKSELVLEYYTYGGRAKIESRIKLADEMGISENALRIRVYYIRQKLEKCVSECMSNEINRTANPIGDRAGQTKS